jgi:flagellar basal-body rod modification protein FlgD
MSIETRLNPKPDAPKGFTYSNVKVNDPTEKQYTDKNRPDFKNILANSMDEVLKKREAIKNGDLSGEDQDEFLQNLANQSMGEGDKRNELQKDDFMKLFVTQLKNQDPLNPDKGAEMATKLATFNSLEQMMNMNKTLESMVTAQNTGRNLQLVSYIGKEVTVDGGRLALKNGKINESEFELKTESTKTSLEIRDGSGTLVLEKELGTFETGKHTLQWDGKNSKGEPLKDGIYTYTIRARDINENNIEVPLVSKAVISGVDLKSENGGIYSGLGPLGFDEIRSVGTPGFDKTSATKQTPNMSTADELKKLQAEENLQIENKDKNNDKKVTTTEEAKSQIVPEQKVDNISKTKTNEVTSKAENVANNEEKKTNSSQDVKPKAETDKSEDKKGNFDFSSIPITIQPAQKS